MRNRFLWGVALLIDANTPAVWRPTGAYSSSEIGIVLHAVPQKPESVVTLSAYSVSDDPSLSDSVLGLQVRARRGGEDPTPTNDLADALFDLLHGLHDVDLPSPDADPGVRVVQMLRRSQVSGGQDQNKRWSDIQNFYATVHYPSINRT